MLFLLNIKVILPELAKFMVKKKIISFFPEESLNFLKEVTEEIIKRRRLKEEVNKLFLCEYKIQVFKIILYLRFAMISFK